MKNHISAYLIFAKEKGGTNLGELDKEGLEFLKKYQDCFSWSLPRTLPPEKSEDHVIVEIPGTSPPNMPPY